MPNVLAYDAEKQQLMLGRGHIEPAPPAVWWYEVSGSRVLMQWFSYRKLAHELIGRRSYKNDASAERLLARKTIVEVLEQGRTRLGLRLKLTPAQAGELVADVSGDRLDAVLCLAQAAWAAGQPRFGQPAEVDAVEGWITTA
jgi:hypothetical protein